MSLLRVGGVSMQANSSRSPSDSPSWKTSISAALIQVESWLSSLNSLMYSVSVHRLCFRALRRLLSVPLWGPHT